jgi:hypothetical protein
MLASLTRVLPKNLYAAFVFAQSWQAHGVALRRPPGRTTAPVVVEADDHAERHGTDNRTLPD